MDEETNKLLKENLEISRESLKILKGIRRANRWATAFKVIYWLVIFGILAGVYYFLEPYINSGIEVVQEFQQTLSGGQKTEAGGTQGTPSISPDALKNISPDLLKQLQNLLNPK
jgi:hypothetical protein